MAAYRIAIVGATGLVGDRLLRVLAERNFPVAELRAFASERSAGRSVRFQDTEIPVQPLEASAFQGMDLVFFAAGTEISRTWAPKAVAAGAIVIDKSNAFRMETEVPLVVPEVNGNRVRDHQGILASPNCSTIQLVVALNPLQRLGRLERVLVSTYQAVSGTGSEALAELEAQHRRDGEGSPRIYPRPIAFNVLPHCDDFVEEGYTREEMKLVNESRRILEREDLRISATAVRVPVRVGHSESVWVEFNRPVDPESIRDVLQSAEGVLLVDRREDGGYPTARDVEGRDEVFVGRIRQDLTNPMGIWFWVVADNLRKGAATNAVQIAERLRSEGLL